MKLKSIFLDYWPIIILLISSFFIVWPLFLPGFFPHHDNIQTIRILEMRKCFEDFQLPCRWVPDMGYGYGFPLFNYYSVFPYYLGAILSYFLGILGAAKALFFIPLIFGGISMYLLGNELFGKRAGFVAALLYQFAPYRALDTYVRGAIAESFAIALVPLVFYFTLRLIRNASFKNLIGFVLSLAAFLTTHNLMTMIFFPILILWTIYWLYMDSKKNIKQILLGFILGFGLSAFFLLPAFFEKSLIQIENLLESEYIPNFRAHFVTSRQLFFDRFWGYGASTWLEADGISFQIGWPHWWLTFINFLILLAWIVKNTFLEGKNIFRKKSIFHLLIFLLLLFATSIFMTHNKSAVIWESINFLQFAQFPWRFLSLTIFCVSLLGGLFIYLIDKTILQLPQKMLLKKLTIGLVIILSVATIMLNWSYFKPEYFDFSATEERLLSGSEWDFQRRGSAGDYLPVGASLPQQIAPDSPQIKEGEARIKKFENRSNRFSFQAQLERESKITIPVYDFPNWIVEANGKKIDHSKNELGVIEINLQKGEYLVEGQFKDTPLRSVANLISILSLAGLIILYRQRAKLS